MLAIQTSEYPHTEWHTKYFQLWWWLVFNQLTSMHCCEAEHNYCVLHLWDLKLLCFEMMCTATNQLQYTIWSRWMEFKTIMIIHMLYMSHCYTCTLKAIIITLKLSITAVVEYSCMHYYNGLDYEVMGLKFSSWD